MVQRKNLANVGQSVTRAIVLMLAIDLDRKRAPAPGD
jgi:hypothetical protein